MLRAVRVPRSMLPRLAVVALLSKAAPAVAQEEKPLSERSLEELMATPVVTPTKEPRRVREAPAIISVVTREDIRQWGFTSVGEALQLVPGLYCTHDYLAADCGVRGITGGQRGYSKNLKVMVDGQPVSFRSDTTNLLGPELLPIDLVERIEVVRGPASAVYGANAFFGVVNIITRQRRDGVSAGAHAQLNDDLGGGVSAEVLAGSQAWGITLGASAQRSDYDGRRLPSSSPDFPVFERTRNLESRDAITRPLSTLATFHLDVGAVSSEVLARYGQLDTVAEFLDFGALTHENRVALHMFDARARTRWQMTERLALVGSLALATGGPSRKERLSIGSEESYPRRRFGYDAWDAVLEGHARLFREDSLVLGADYTRDDEDLLEVFRVDRDTGQQTRLSPEAGHKLFTNVGVYVQYVSHPMDVLSLTANARHDRHNLYGDTTNFRLGGVWTPSERVSAKLLYGTAFKAPAALELYAQPLFPGDAVGNPELRPETSRMLEGEVHWQPSPTLALSLAGFLGRVRDKVEVTPFGSNFQPRNTGRQDGIGLEAEGRWLLGRHTLSGSYAYQHTHTKTSDIFLGEVSTPTQRYPRVTAQLRWQYREPVLGTFSAALRHASARLATSANVQANRLHPYELPAYLVLDAAYLQSWERHTLQLRLGNLLDLDDPEPGFGGIDVPKRGRELMLRYSYEL
ncbi:TonB-dependent receptor plug domain-containing protein [Pyxidicoccus sp. MSG2]|uniref:TonB-dependent receptor plug domain-containing protein n=1 Tax=Pyxidicoccus sp. MSG2 TaxID=2996790 RepID=UPI00226EF9D3|nr:TonB-dependent receptor [Pyxidicoccus sp. MSG2]MCY1019123.1 TonB-dependent receptor [Pyxidicoccus sp. MSG2]